MTVQSLARAAPASLLRLKATALGHALQGASRPGLFVLVSLGRCCCGERCAAAGGH